MKRLRDVLVTLLCLLVLHAGAREVAVHHCCLGGAASSAPSPVVVTGGCPCCADHAPGVACCRQAGTGVQLFRPSVREAFSLGPVSPAPPPAAFLPGGCAVALPPCRSGGPKPFSRPHGRKGRWRLALFSVLLL